MLECYFSEKILFPQGKKKLKVLFCHALLASKNGYFCVFQTLYTVRELLYHPLVRNKTTLGHFLIHVLVITLTQIAIKFILDSLK